MKIKRLLTTITAAAIIAVNAFPNAVYAAALEKLTVDKATQWAVSSSNDLKKSDESYIQNMEKLDSLKEDLWNVGSNAELALSYSTQIMQLEMSMSVSLDSTEVTKEKMRASMMKYFAAIINAEKGLELYDISLELEQRQLTITKVKSTLGLVSQADYDQAKNSYTQKVNDRKTKEKAITDAYRTLNTAMGRHIDTRYELVFDTIEYKPLGSTNLTAQMATAVNESTSIKSLSNNITIEKYKLDTKLYTSKVNEYETDEIAYNQALRAYDDGIKSVETNVRNSYDKIMTYERTYESTLIDLENVYTQLKIKETQLELGKITELDLDNYKYSIMQKEESLRQLIVDHHLEVMAYKNPILI